MPKENIDYSNTIIYKIYCNDKSIHDVYVGHTTNFTKRKHQHKSVCSNLNNKLKIYSTIRENGGWDNWNMIEIANYNCKDKTEARIKEQQHYVDLNSSLNSCPPYVDKNKYFCSTCNINCTTKNVYETHINCSLHKKNTQLDEGDKIKQKISKNYCCEFCDYNTDRKSNLTNHFKSDKHVKEINGTNVKQKFSTHHNCENCHKKYETSAGLWKHNKKCFKKEENNISSEMILNIIQQNQEFKDMLIEQNKLIIELSKNSTTINNTNNSHNKTFKSPSIFKRNM